MSRNLKPALVAADPAIGQTARRLLESYCRPDLVIESEHGSAPADLWSRCAVAGIPWIGRSDGENGGILDAAAVLHEAGRAAAPLPLAENGVIGGWLLGAVSRHSPNHPVTVPVPVSTDTMRLNRKLGGFRLAGRWNSVPWTALAGQVISIVPDDGGHGRWVCVDTGRLRIRASRNLAGEPRDIIDADIPVAAEDVEETGQSLQAQLRLRGALSRAALMGGAMERCVELASQYSTVRKQFGRPLSAFQAVQHLLALAAEHAALTLAAVTIAADALDSDPLDPFQTVAVARTVAHDAHHVVASNAHQVFGAIGITREHELHLRTRRLWSWDSEWGDPLQTAADYGTWLIGRGGHQLWPTLTNATRRHQTPQGG